MSSGNTKSLFFHCSDFVFRNENILTVLSGSGSSQVSIHFAKKDNALISLSRSPFGGFVYAGKAEMNRLLHLLDEVELVASKNNIDSLLIICPPEIYVGDDAQIIRDALSQRGFQLKFTDIAQVIKVSSELPLNLNRNRQRQLIKCRDAEFHFKQLPLEALATAYDLIVESRNNKGYPVTMSLAELQKMFLAFPDNYLLFGVFDGPKIIACSVSIVVNASILYCFYFGDSIAYRKFSAVTMLANEIYKYAVQQHFKIIDLGISTFEGVLNSGLYQFKKSLGAIDSVKLTFERKL